MKLYLMIGVALWTLTSLQPASASDPEPSKPSIFEQVGDAFRSGTRAVGHAFRDTTRAIGHGTRDAAKAIGSGTRDAAEGVGEAASNSWKEMKGEARSK